MNSVFCQFCGAPNPSGRERCEHCGSVLIIVSGPPEEPDEPTEELFLAAQEEYEEHLFERLTALEEANRQLAQALAGAAERLGQLEHQLSVALAGVENLGALLEDHGVLPQSEILSGWEERLDREILSRDLSRRFLRRAQRILSRATHDGTDSEDFRRRLRALELALIGQDSERAAAEIGELARLAPSNDELWSFIGEVAFETGETEAARSAFERVLGLRGPHFESLIYLGTVLTDLGQWDEAREVLLKAGRMEPTSFLPPFSIGALEVMRDRPAEALPFLDRVLELEDLPQGRYLKGVCELRLGRTGRAIAELQRAVEGAPEFEDALYQLGLAYLRRGWTRKALATFREVLSLDPQRLEYQQAVRLLTRPPEGSFRPEVARLVSRAETLLERGRASEALDLYESAARISPEEPSLVATSALLASALGEARVAVSEGRRLLRLERDGVSPYLPAGVVAVLEGLRQAGRLQSARRAAERLLREHPDPLVRGLAAYELALVEAELGEDLGRARDLALEALESTPRELRHFPLGALGAIALRRGHYREAVRYLEQATEAAPEPTLLRQLAVARLETGDAPGAEEALEAAQAGVRAGLEHELLGHVRRMSQLRAVTAHRSREHRRRS